MAATLPKQDTCLQDCLRKAWDDNKAFIRYSDFNNMLKNIGVYPTYEQEKLIKELLVHKRILRVARIGDIHADVRYCHQFTMDIGAMIAIIDIEINHVDDARNDPRSRVDYGLRLTDAQRDARRFGEELARLVHAGLEQVDDCECRGSDRILIAKDMLESSLLLKEF